MLQSGFHLPRMRNKNEEMNEKKNSLIYSNLVNKIKLRTWQFFFAMKISSSQYSHDL